MGDYNYLISSGMRNKKIQDILSRIPENKIQSESANGLSAILPANMAPGITPESSTPKLNTTESQYQDLINKLINSKPIETIDPLQRMLSAISGSSALQTTNLPQSNRLGQMFSDGTNAIANAIETKNKDLRLWDTEKVNLLHNLLANETARTKAEVEAKRLAEEHVFKANEDKRQEAVAAEKRNTSGVLGTIGDILNPDVYNKTPDYNAAINLAAGIGNTSLMGEIKKLQNPSPIEYKPSTEEGKVGLEKKIATVKEEAKHRTNDTSSTKNYEYYKDDIVRRNMQSEGKSAGEINAVIKSKSHRDNYVIMWNRLNPKNPLLITSYNDWRKENANSFNDVLAQALGIPSQSGGVTQSGVTQRYVFDENGNMKAK